FPSLLAGAVLCWARALGEFGATIMFAGSFRGRTQTMPLAIYGALETDLGAALALGTILVGVSVAVLAAVHLLTRRREAPAGPAAPRLAPLGATLPRARAGPGRPAPAGPADAPALPAAGPPAPPPRPPGPATDARG